MFAKIEKDSHGRILHAFCVFADQDPSMFPGVLVNDGVVDQLIYKNEIVVDTYYWDNDLGGIYPRTPSPATINRLSLTANGVDEVIISGLSGESSLWVDGKKIGNTTETSIEFSVDLPGNYLLVVKSVKYFDIAFEVTAT